MIFLPNGLKKWMLPALSAALLFSACTVDDIVATVIPLGSNVSYAVSDTAIVYQTANDTARTIITYRLDADTVYTTAVRHAFEENTQAAAFYNDNCESDEYQSIQLENRTVSYTLTNYDGLTTKDIVNILEDEYVYHAVCADSLAQEREFSVRSFGGLQDGMYFMLARKLSEGRLFFHDCSMHGQTLNATYINDRSVLPWRLRQADGVHWYIQLSNGDYLRRSGNRIVPLALTATPLQEKATAWSIDDIVEGLNFWTLYSDIGDTQEFYGLTTEDSNTLHTAVNAIETFSMLVNHVKATFCVEGETWTTHTSLWGCTLPLPSYTEVREGYTFIGWNTVENSIEGYQAPGTLVDADNTTYHAIFVKNQ